MLMNRLAGRFCLNSAHTLSRYLHPVSLALTPAPEMPTIKLRSEKEILANWWSLRPFDIQAGAPLVIPVFSFETG